MEKSNKFLNFTVNLLKLPQVFIYWGHPVEANQVRKYKRIKVLAQNWPVFRLANTRITLPLLLQGIWTELSGNLNLSQIALGLYPTKHLVELYLFDANGTQFAKIHSDRGASLQRTNESHPVRAYWNRLRIERGSLIFLEINEADNGTKIIVQARLNPEQTSKRLESLSTKTIQIFVFHSAGKHGVIEWKGSNMMTNLFTKFLAKKSTLVCLIW